MRKVLAVLILVFNLNANAQDVTVEKSIFGIQTGFGVHVGIWFNNESKVSSSIALRSEIGLEKDFTVGDHYDGTGFIMQPVVTLEPRYYYNLEKRNSNGKQIANNSGNYFSIKTSYHPDWFVINLADNVTKTADLAIVPTWGLKRTIGNHFTYETAVGFGYRVVYLKENSVNGNVQSTDGAYNRNQYIPYLHLGIGYTF